MENDKKNDVKPKTLARKIADISAALGAIAKDGINKEQKYAFIAYAAVAGKLRTIQAEHGVAVFPHVEDYTKDEVRSKGGLVGYHYVLKMKFRVVNADDMNDFMEQSWLGEATDYGDKGINKAETSATKYFYMRLYNISEKGETEADNNTPEQFPKDYKRNPQTKPSQAAQKPEPKVNYQLLHNVRGKLPTLDTVIQLEKYRQQLKLDDLHWQLLKKDFAKRKKEIEDGLERCTNT